MTDPTTLKNFITWRSRTYPANHYLLVLWNHGGGYTGLIQDQTYRRKQHSCRSRISRPRSPA